MDEDRRAAIRGTVGLFLSLTWLSVALRVYVRFWKLRTPQSADFLIILTQLIFTILCALEIVGAAHGMGQHIYHINILDMWQGPHYEFYIELLYVITTTFLRLSIGSQLWAIVGGKPMTAQKAQRLAIIVTVGITVSYSVAFFFALLFQCHPVSFFWKQYQGIQDGSCMPSAVSAGLAYTHAALSTAADWILGLLPIWMLWNTQLPTRTKATVISLLGIGAIAGVVAIARIPYIKDLIYSYDFFWDCAPIIIASTIEPALGIIAACIATYRPLFARNVSIHQVLPSTGRTGLLSGISEKSRAGIQDNTEISSPDIPRDDRYSTAPTIEGQIEKRKATCATDISPLRRHPSMLSRTNRSGDIKVNTTVEIQRSPSNLAKTPAGSKQTSSQFVTSLSAPPSWSVRPLGNRATVVAMNSGDRLNNVEQKV